ncbi:MAG: UvrD-helicase domain-containing protein [Clostridia bacterium]|nr:UvrD-helicase domain-containing protein [Clostridia bacterium]
MGELLGGLNDAQLLAVRATEGYVRVVAGAGSGKTRALTRRYAYLVEGLGISPSNILCVTFTNKAANEMRNRVRSLIGTDEPISLVCTYHGFCVKVLREDINKLYYPRGFAIMDEQDQRMLLREIYAEMGITAKNLTFKNCLDFIAAKKDNHSYIDRMESFESLDGHISRSSDLAEKIFYCYLKKQKKNFALDFDDLINFALHILENHPDVLARWRDRLHYIQVDEFQDSDAKQFRLVSLLSKGHGNLFVVGDPDQTIYEWRGARPEFIVDFQRIFPNAKSIVMDRNYRSTPEILDVGNSIIKNNKMRVDKDMHTKNAPGPTAVHFHGMNEDEETKWVIGRIRHLVEQGASLDEMAILYRANYLSRALEQALIREKIDYVVYSGVKFFERREIKDIMAYLRMLSGADDISFLRTVNFPPRGIGKKKIDFIREKAAAEGISLYDAFSKYSGNAVFHGCEPDEYINLIEGMKSQKGRLRVSEIASALLNKSGFMEFYRRDGDNARLDNISEFMTYLINYEQAAGEDVSLDEYLQDLSLYTDADLGDEGDRVKLMTIHVAKGLEFPYVFLYGMSEDIIPNARALQERKLKALEEERRLAYVAVTRARKALFLTESEGALNGGGFKYPSRFLLEIGEGMVAREGKINPELLEMTRERASGTAAPSGETFSVGDIVLHPVWNQGEVVGVDDEKGEYSVKFDEMTDIRHIRMKYRLMVRKA